MSQTAASAVAPARPAPAGPSRRRIALGAAILLTLAGLTRLAGLGDLPLWLDEVHSYVASTDLPANLLRWDTLHQQYHSPLTFLEIKAARAVLGNGATAVRLPSAIQGALAVAALYLLVGRFVSWGAAWWAALLLALVAAAPLLMLQPASTRLAFHPRYLHVALLAWAVGLGVLAAEAWGGSPGGRAWKRAAVVIVLAGLGLSWWSWWREVYRTPKMDVAAAFAPIRRHAQPREALLTLPHWGREMSMYHALPPVLLAVAPPGRVPAPGDKAPAFEAVFGVPGGSLPPATWVFLTAPAGQLEALRPVLRAYGVDEAAALQALTPQAREALTLTARIDAGGLQHVTVTRGRRH